MANSYQCAEAKIKHCVLLPSLSALIASAIVCQDTLKKMDCAVKNTVHTMRLSYIHAVFNTG